MTLKEILENKHLYRLKTVEEMKSEFSVQYDKGEEWRGRIQLHWAEGMDPVAGLELINLDLKIITPGLKLNHPLIGGWNISVEMITLIEKEHNSLNEIYPLL